MRWVFLRSNSKAISQKCTAKFFIYALLHWIFKKMGRHKYERQVINLETLVSHSPYFTTFHWQMTFQNTDMRKNCQNTEHPINIYVINHLITSRSKQDTNDCECIRLTLLSKDCKTRHGLLLFETLWGEIISFVTSPWMSSKYKKTLIIPHSQVRFVLTVAVQNKIHDLCMQHLCSHWH